MDENRYWWEVKRGDEELADLLVSRCQAIEEAQRYWYDDCKRHARLYDGRCPPHYDWNAGIVRPDQGEPELTKNVIRSVVDTASAMISRVRPKATVVTDGAEWSVQRLARQLDQFLVGAFNVGGIYPAATMAFRDSCVFGSGAMRLSVEKGRVCVDRVPIGDIVVDETLCIGGATPPELFHRRLVSIDSLKRSYPKLRSRLDSIREDNTGLWTSGRSLAPGQAVLVEGWYLEEGKRRYVKAVRGLVLEDRDWEYEWNPFIFLHWSPPIEGFYGKGIAYSLAGRQRRINSIYRFITKCQELISVPRVWVDAAGGPMKTQMVPEIGVVLATPGGKPPVWQIPQAVAPEIYSWLNGLEQGSYEEIGISQLSAANRLPPGIESAPAQREYSYKEGQRFATISQRYEDAFIDTAYRMLDLYASISGSGGKPSVPYARRTLVQKIDWPKIGDIDRERYLIRIEASSLDSLSPAGRVQAVLELGQGGLLFDQKELRRLIGHPDLERSEYLTDASWESAEMTLEDLLNLVPRVPLPYQDPDLTARIVRAGYLRAYEDKAPIEVLENLSRFLEELDAKMAAAQAAMAPPAQPLPAMSAASSQGLGLPFQPGGGQSIAGT